MLFDKQTVINMAKRASVYSGNKPHMIYQTTKGAFVFCADGNQPLLKEMLSPGEKLQFIGKVVGNEEM